VTEDNSLLRAARERVPSRRIPGERLSRTELAESVNAWLWEHTDRRFELDDHLIGKWERGRVLWPIAAYRAALRAVLDVDSDAALGFRPPSRRSSGPAPCEDEPWTRERIARKLSDWQRGAARYASVVDVRESRAANVRLTAETV